MCLQRQHCQKVQTSWLLTEDDRRLLGSEGCLGSVRDEGESSRTYGQGHCAGSYLFGIWVMQLTSSSAWYKRDSNAIQAETS